MPSDSPEKSGRRRKRKVLSYIDPISTRTRSQNSIEVARGKLFTIGLNMFAPVRKKRTNTDSTSSGEGLLRIRGTAEAAEGEEMEGDNIEVRDSIDKLEVNGGSRDGDGEEEEEEEEEEMCLGTEDKLEKKPAEDVSDDSDSDSSSSSSSSDSDSDSDSSSSSSSDSSTDTSAEQTVDQLPSSKAPDSGSEPTALEAGARPNEESEVSFRKTYTSDVEEFDSGTESEDEEVIIGEGDTRGGETNAEEPCEVEIDEPEEVSKTTSPTSVAPSPPTIAVHSPVSNVAVHSPYVAVHSPHVHSPHVHSPHVHSPHVHSPHVAVHSPVVSPIPSPRGLPLLNPISSQAMPPTSVAPQDGSMQYPSLLPPIHPMLSHLQQVPFRRAYTPDPSTSTAATSFSANYPVSLSTPPLSSSSSQPSLSSQFPYGASAMYQQYLQMLQRHALLKSQQTPPSSLLAASSAAHMLASNSAPMLPNTTPILNAMPYLNPYAAAVAAYRNPVPGLPQLTPMTSRPLAQQYQWPSGPRLPHAGPQPPRLQGPPPADSNCPSTSSSQK